jgi:long-chain-fatty-acid--[acyl-carrier-protein] ligase
MVKKTPINKKITSLAFKFVLWLRYKITIKNKDFLHNNNVKLFLPNHQSLIDPIILTTYFNRYEITSPAVSDAYYKSGFFRFFLKIVNAIPVSDIEAGNRDPNVLSKISEQVVYYLKNGQNILIYPSGQLASQGLEKIRNKQGTHKIASIIPENIQIIGVRVNGLWGSSWSKASSGKTPDFLKTLLKGIGIVVINLIFFCPRRKVNIELVDITSEIKVISTADRKTFNQHLENFYNLNGEEPVNKKKYFWL